MFILMMTGFALGKKKLLNKTAIESINEIVLNLVIPCTVLNGFQANCDYGMMADVFKCMLWCGILLAIFLIASRFIVRLFPVSERPIYMMSCTLTNCAFVGFPLDTAIIGSLGVFYGSGYVAIMNMVMFTCGYYVFSHDKSVISLKNVLLRPGVIGTILAIALYFLKIQLPSVIGSAVGYFAALCVPLPMLIIGYHLSQVSFSEALKSPRIWICSAIKLVVFPMLSLALMVICGVKGNILLATLIGAGCPCASIVTILADQYGYDSKLAAEVNAMQTALSVITLPFLIAFAMLYM